MSRAKTRRPATRSGRRAESLAELDARPAPRRIEFRSRKPAPTHLPDDLPEAAEVALDELLSSAEAALNDREEPEITADADDHAPEPEPPPRRRPPPAPGAKRARTNVSEPELRRPAPSEPVQRTLSHALDAIDDDQLVEEHQLPSVARLRFAVFEIGEHLAAAQRAIEDAGHVVAIAGMGVAKLVEAVVAGGIDAVLVAIPGGETVIDAALALEPRRPVVIAVVAGKVIDAIPRAIAAGADLALSRPHDVERVAPILLAAARLHLERRDAQTARGAEQVLRAKLEEISDPEPRGLQPFEVFQRVLELEFKRARRFEYALSVALFAVEVEPPPPPAGIRGILRARAGNAIIHTIRDIDLATQLDHERFLVLLPYTDLSGAANLARRVISAVAQGDPVVSGGRSFPPRVVGAVAGARPGQPLSFAKLMKDATRALEQARRDGAELAVEP